jgi:hypothetical protein
MTRDCGCRRRQSARTHIGGLLPRRAPPLRSSKSSHAAQAKGPGSMRPRSICCWRPILPVRRDRSLALRTGSWPGYNAHFELRFRISIRPMSAPPERTCPGAKAKSAPALEAPRVRGGRRGRSAGGVVRGAPWLPSTETPRTRRDLGRPRPGRQEIGGLFYRRSFEGFGGQGGPKENSKPKLQVGRGWPIEVLEVPFARWVAQPRSAPDHRTEITTGPHETSPFACSPSGVEKPRLISCWLQVA